MMQDDVYLRFDEKNTFVTIEKMFSKEFLFDWVWCE